MKIYKVNLASRLIHRAKKEFVSNCSSVNKECICSALHKKEVTEKLVAAVRATGCGKQPQLS